MKIKYLYIFVCLLPKINPNESPQLVWTQLSLNELHCAKLINFSILRKAFNFYLKVDKKKKLDSPILKPLIQEVFQNKRNYYALDKLDTLRDHLKRDNSKVQHTDFGAGSQYKTKDKTIASFVKSSASDKYKGEILFHLSRYFRPHRVLELGTNLGMGAAYLASANSFTHVKSLEGCPNLSAAARIILSSVGIKNVDVITGKFSSTLINTCRELESIDMVFIDGDHSYQSTVDNYKTIKSFLHSKSVVIFDDIYWSDGMKKAWEEVKKDKDVVLSIDVFTLGIIFFDKELHKGELKIVPNRYKPWK